MTRVVDQVGGVNLAQGMPNFPPPPELIAAAHRAIDGDFHQYAVTWGTPRLRQAIAEKYRRLYGMEIDPDRHVTVCCGSTETMLSTLLAVLNPADEVIIFEPFYENYGPGCIISGARPVFVPLEPPDFSFDGDRLRGAVTSRTRAIILNSPNNPTGKVFSRSELQAIANLSLARDLLWGYIEKAGFVAWKPRGAYYILTDVAHFLKRYDVLDDTAFAMWLIRNVGVATVPGSSFYAHPELGRTKIRFCFPKTDDMLRDAGERLLKLRS